MPIKRDDIELKKADFLLKEIEIIQKVLDKIDGWIVQLRVGIVAGITGLLAVRFSSPHAAAACNMLVLQFSLIAMSWIGEAVLRWTHQYGYLKRREKIEEFLNSNGTTELRLFDPKGEHTCSIDRSDKWCRCCCKINTVVFHIGAAILTLLATHVLYVSG